MDPERPQTKPFAQFVQEQRHGGLHGELSDALADVVAAVAELGKPGTLTLKLSIKPGDALGTILVFDDYTAKAPQPDRPAGLFFADDHGNLSRRDPRQPELPLRDVSGGESKPDDLREAQAK